MGSDRRAGWRFQTLNLLFSAGFEGTFPKRFVNRCAIAPVEKLAWSSTAGHRPAQQTPVTKSKQLLQGISAAQLHIHATNTHAHLGGNF